MTGESARLAPGVRPRVGSALDSPDLQPAGGGRASALRVVVLHGDQIVHEDKTAMSVRLGRATYREITLCK